MQPDPSPQKKRTILSSCNPSPEAPKRPFSEVAVAPWLPMVGRCWMPQDAPESTNNKKLLGAPGIATRSKDATRGTHGLTTSNKKLLGTRASLLALNLAASFLHPTMTFEFQGTALPGDVAPPEFTWQDVSRCFSSQRPPAK